MILTKFSLLSTPDMMLCLTERLILKDAMMTAAVNKNTNGIDYSPLIRMMIVKESSWTGFYFPPVVSVDVL